MKNILLFVAFMTNTAAFAKNTNTASIPEDCFLQAANRIVAYLQSEDSDTQLAVVKNQQGKVQSIIDMSDLNADLDLESVQITSKNKARIVFSSQDYSAWADVKFDPQMQMCSVLKVDSKLNN